MLGASPYHPIVGASSRREVCALPGGPLRRMKPTRLNGVPRVKALFPCHRKPGASPASTSRPCRSRIRPKLAVLRVLRGEDA